MQKVKEKTPETVVLSVLPTKCIMVITYNWAPITIVFIQHSFINPVFSN